MSRASENEAHVLHGTLFRTLTRMCQTRTVTKTDKEGNTTEEEVDPSPAALAVAAKLLKDNSVFITAEQSTAVGELEDALEARRKAGKDRKKVTKADMDAAMATIRRDILQ